MSEDLTSGSTAGLAEDPNLPADTRDQLLALSVDRLGIGATLITDAHFQVAMEEGFEALTRQFYVVNIAPDGDMMDLRMVGDAEPPSDARPVPPTLEDAYVHFMEMGSETLVTESGPSSHALVEP